MAARVDDLTRRVEHLEHAPDRDAEVASLAARVTALEQRPSPVPAPSSSAVAVSWSCAATCLVGYQCVTLGKSSVRSRLITGTGSTAAAAFNALGLQCPNQIYVTGECTNGRFAATDATLVNACVRN